MLFHQHYQIDYTRPVSQEAKDVNMSNWVRKHFMLFCFCILMAAICYSLYFCKGNVKKWFGRKRSAGRRKTEESLKAALIDLKRAPPTSSDTRIVTSMTI
ncbi:unnamed protein product [Caenorhabditis auriculariae]|uniref:Uncharacterized protein n=1 Tax=Caenorhabditis auriculariae TaxID=2777116 RepID=A0A8S1GTU0_9PELO|nr:unnamed protein product [Caenorhabditis auriculariae]